MNFVVYFEVVLGLVCFVFVGMGIGFGIIIDGWLVYSYYGLVGEIGSLFIYFILNVLILEDVVGLIVIVVKYGCDMCSLIDVLLDDFVVVVVVGELCDILFWVLCVL